MPLLMVKHPVVYGPTGFWSKFFVYGNFEGTRFGFEKLTFQTDTASAWACRRREIMDHKPAYGVCEAGNLRVHASACWRLGNPFATVLDHRRKRPPENKQAWIWWDTKLAVYTIMSVRLLMISHHQSPSGKVTYLWSQNTDQVKAWFPNFGAVPHRLAKPESCMD